MIQIPNAMRRPAESRRDELERENSELKALVEQMTEALKSADVVVSFYEANNDGAGRGIGQMIEAALNAAKGAKE